MAIVDLLMPKLGESIMEATILKWHKKTGDVIEQDETILDIATDKVDSEVPSTAAGTLAEILFKENDVVPVGAVIARIETSASEAISDEIISEEDDKVHAALLEALIDIPLPVKPVPAEAKPAIATVNRFYSPLVLNIVNSEGISLTELENIPGTGNEGRVTKNDILQYVAQKKNGVATPVATVITAPAAEPAVPETNATVASEPAIAVKTEPLTSVKESTVEYAGGNVEIIEMDRMRKLISKHMVDSKQTSAHVTSFTEADVTNMVLWRDKIKYDFEKRENTRITFTPLFIDCLARVIKQFPLINSSVDGDKIIIKKDINIGMATALASGNLIVPVIKNADYLNLVGLSKKVNALAYNARSGKLKPDDTVGGTFTFTNVGTFGSLMGTPIINQPQVAILAVGAIKKRPVVIETKQGDTIGIRHMMYLSLSYDHRIIDGSLGASFLTAVAKELENWNPDKTW